jgi:hypothetical protein
MRNKIYRTLLWLQSKAFYWKAQYRLRQIRGKRGSFNLKLKTKREGLRDVLRALAIIARQAGWILAIVVAIAVLILWVEQSGVWLWVESKAGIPSSSQTPRLYGVVASLTGLFVSIYFTAVGFLTTTFYRGASSELRSTALSERISNVYVRLVLGTGSLSFCFLIAEAVGYSTRSLAIFTVGICGVLALLATGTLLGSTLRFFNPSSFAGEAHRDLVRIINYLNSGTSVENQRSIQKALRKRAREILGLFDESLDLCKSDSQPSAVAKIGKYSVSLLQSYWKKKLTLSAESGWWQPEPKSKGWFLASHSSIDMALKAGRPLRTEAELDSLWMERELSSTLATSLRNLLRRQKWSDAAKLIANANAAIRTGAERLLIEEALVILSEVEAALIDHSDLNEDQVTKDRGTAPAEVWDAYGAGCVQLLLGSREGLQRIRPGSIGDLISTIDWNDEQAVSSTPVVPNVKGRLEEIGEVMRFEQTVEGKILTPKWYQIEALTPELLRVLHAHTEKLQAHISHLYEDVIPLLRERESYLSGCQLIERCIEIQSKWELFAGDANETSTRLNSLVRAEDFEIPEFDWEGLQQDLVESDQEIVDCFVDFIPDLLIRLENTKAQEFLGHIYSLLTDRCAEAAVSGNQDRFAELFDNTFYLGLFLWGRIPLKENKLRTLQETKIGVQPLLDIMALSGLALTRDEIDGPGFYGPVSEKWNDFISGRQDSQGLMETLLYVGDKSVVTFGFGARSTVRTSWKQRMDRNLEERGFPTGFGSRSRQSGSSSNRPFRGAVLSGTPGIRDPIDIFLGFIIATRSEAIGLDWPQGARSFLRAWTGNTYQ